MSNNLVPHVHRILLESLSWGFMVFEFYLVTNPFLGLSILPGPQLIIGWLWICSCFRYGLIEPTYRDNFSGIAYPCRGLFLVDPDKILKMMCFHPWSLGRSTDEILRSIDSVQLTRKYENKVCTPADWTVKVDIFEEGCISDICIDFLKYLWPSQNIWTVMQKS